MNILEPRKNKVPEKGKFKQAGWGVTTGGTKREKPQSRLMKKPGGIHCLVTQIKNEAKIVRECLACLDNVAFRNHKLLNKNHSSRCEMHKWVIGLGPSRCLKTIQNLLFPLSSLGNLGDKMLVLNIPCASVAIYGENKLELNWNHPPWCLAFIVLHRPLEEKQHQWSTQLRTLMSFNIKLPGKMCPLVQQ